MKGRGKNTEDGSRDWTDALPVQEPESYRMEQYNAWLEGGPFVKEVVRVKWIRLAGKKNGHNQRS